MPSTGHPAAAQPWGSHLARPRPGPRLLPSPSAGWGSLLCTCSSKSSTAHQEQPQATAQLDRITLSLPSLEAPGLGILYYPSLGTPVKLPFVSSCRDGERVKPAHRASEANLQSEIPSAKGFGSTWETCIKARLHPYSHHQTPVQWAQQHA